MKEELISFETAILAKEKGFNIEQGRYYNSHGQLNESLEDFFIPRFEAPSQSLLQRWLREVHKIHIGISYYPTGWNCQVLPGLDVRNSICDTTDYPSYGSALEAALQTALKLIV